MSKEGTPNLAVLEARKRTDAERTALVDRRCAIEKELSDYNEARVAGLTKARALIKERDEIDAKLNPTDKHSQVVAGLAVEEPAAENG